MPVAYSVVDQALAVGAGFLVNIALARTQTKEEYGMFALSYSVFTFLSGLHNAAILETYTVYGAGRYHARNREYSWLIWRSNVLLCAALTVLLLLAWKLTALASPKYASRPLLGLAAASAEPYAGSGAGCEFLGARADNDVATRQIETVRTTRRLIT